MPSEYLLLNTHKAEDKTHEAEDEINAYAEEGWEVVGYSAHGWRGVATAGFNHLILMRRRLTHKGGRPDLYVP